MFSSQQCVFCWSGGKDSALALYKVRSGEIPGLRIHCLMTTLSEAHKRISMHGVRQELLHAQARSLNLPIHEVFLPENATMDHYDAIMYNAWQQYRQDGVRMAVFGDIFLQDLRTYREEQLNKVGSKAVFPLWNIDTTELAREFIDLGFKSIIVAVDADKLGESFAGRMFDHQLLNDLPENVDPCGENGEFHSFVFDGPGFSNPVPFQTGEKVLKKYPLDSNDEQSYKGFWFVDLK